MMGSRPIDPRPRGDRRAGARHLTTAIAPPVEAAPEGQISFAVHVTLAPKWLDPGGDGVGHHAVHDALRDPRCPRQAHAGRAQYAEPGGVVDGVEGRPHLRVPPEQRHQVPQRRSRHRGRREVLLRALSRRRGQALQGAREGGAGRRRAPGPLRHEGAVARLHDLLRHDGHRGRVDRPQEVRREGRRRGLPEGAHRGGPVQVRQPDTRAST